MIHRTRLSQPGRILTTFSNPERVRSRFVKPAQIGTVVASHGNKVALSTNGPLHITSITGPFRSSVLSLSKSSQIVVTQVTTGLRGPRGLDASAMPSSPVFTWSGGLLVRVDYQDGSFKVFTWGGSVLIRTEFTRVGSDNVRRDFNYNEDGSISSVVQTNF